MNCLSRSKGEKNDGVYAWSIYYRSAYIGAYTNYSYHCCFAFLALFQMMIMR